MNKNMQWLKIAVCVIGVLMIAGAITYTVMTRNAVSSNAQASNSATASTTASNKSTSDGVGELNWVNSLRSKFETNDFIIVIFPGNDDSIKQVDQVVKTATDKIRQNGTFIDSMTLSSTDPEFKATLDRLAIQKLPAVLVIAASGQGGVIKGDITETKLLQTFLSLQKTCVPGTSGCCP